MPYVYVYECNRCHADVEIVLSREFEVTAAGERRDYQYPDPDLYEWPQRRVSGLWSHLWCPGCRAVREHVLVELEQPAEHPVQAFLTAEARGMTGRETGPCTVCGTPLRLSLEGEPCPACAEGRMVSIGEYEP
jgi:hypothetical protein